MFINLISLLLKILAINENGTGLACYGKPLDGLRDLREVSSRPKKARQLLIRVDAGGRWSPYYPH